VTPRADAKLWKRTIKVARHEAAHAVMAEICGHTVLLVVLSKAGGFCRHGIDAKIPDPLQLGMIYMAGHAADVLWSRANRVHPPVDDHRFLERMGFRDRSFATLLGFAMGTLHEEKDAVFAVAKALKAQNFTGDDVRRIIQETKQPKAGESGKSNRTTQHRRQTRGAPRGIRRARS